MRPLGRIAGALISVLTLVGCGAVDNAFNPPRVVVAELQVWNRTLDAVFILDAEGTRLDVPACGHAVAPRFVLNRVEVRTDAGLYFGTGTSGVGDQGRPQRLVITSDPGDSALAADEPLAFPRCEGHAVVSFTRAPDPSASV